MSKIVTRIFSFTKSSAIVFAALISLAAFTPRLAVAQKDFAERCSGTWKGTMQIYAHGQLKDSVRVQLTVASRPDNSWTWKTEYLSDKRPMVKDYILRLSDSTKQVYITDEGDGIQLYDYRFGNKLYSVFETEGILLTSSYELREKELIFEVSSGKKQPAAGKEVINYSVDFLQRVVFYRDPG